jgi:hypothetical protein
MLKTKARRKHDAGQRRTHNQLSMRFRPNIPAQLKRFAITDELNSLSIKKQLEDANERQGARPLHISDGDSAVRAPWRNIVV